MRSSDTSERGILSWIKSRDVYDLEPTQMASGADRFLEMHVESDNNRPRGPLDPVGIALSELYSL